ncbi:MAG: CoA transferase [Microbacterium sp.]
MSGIPHDGPLSGVRVLDLGSSWAGPFTGMILADLGADVIKVESSTKIDILRIAGAFADDVRDVERSGWYTSCNRGKRSLALDLKSDEGKEVLRDLVAVSDVLIENFAPRVMPGLGFDYAALSARNPGLVMVSMSGYGSTGPQRHYVSYGDHLMQSAGLAAQTGAAGDPPTMIGTFYGDPVGGLFGTVGLLAALEESGRTGRGSWLDLSQLEALVAMQPTEFVRTALGEAVAKTADGSDRGVPHGFFRGRGPDAWVALSVRTDAEWAALRDALRSDGSDVGDFETLAERRAAEPEISEAVTRWAAARSPWDVAVRLQALGIAAHPVADAPGLLRDAQLRSRDFFQWVDRPVSGPDIIPGVTLRVADDGARVRGRAPLLGEHSREIVVGLFGRSPEEFERLLADGAIA